MKKFVLLLHGKPESAYTKEEMQIEIEMHGAWLEDLNKKNAMLGGDGLDDQSILIKQGNTITDGPYIESKELVGGYYVLQAESMEAAIELAKGCPTHQLGGVTEIRPVMDYEQYG
jgi:hypothetical protein